MTGHTLCRGAVAAPAPDGVRTLAGGATPPLRGSDGFLPFIPDCQTVRWRKSQTKSQLSIKSLTALGTYSPTSLPKLCSSRTMLEDRAGLSLRR